MTPRDWLAISAVLVGLLATVCATRTIAARFGFSSESSRKSVHVVMGMACCAFPWIFPHPAPVWILAALATVPILALRLIPTVRSSFGNVLHGISRPSYGEILFAPAVAAVFQLSAGNEVLHLVPVLILTLADAAGAMAGTRWGKHIYASGGGFKSIEGSGGFLLVAFASILIPLLFMGSMDFAHAAWIALILATLAMMAEGFSDRGFDNIVLPLGCFFVLERLLPLEISSLAGRFVVLALLLTLVLASARWSSLSGAALLGSAMLGYGCAVLADWRYALPPCAVFISHIITTRKHQLTNNFQHRLDVVTSHAIACMPWVLACTSGISPPDVGLVGISLAMATQLALLDNVTRRRTGRTAQPARSLAKGLLFAAVPGLVFSGIYLQTAILPVAINSLATLILMPINTRAGIAFETKHSSALWFGKGMASLAASLTALLLP